MKNLSKKINMPSLFEGKRSVLMAALLVSSSGAMACASCGCSLNSDWGTQGLSNQAGWSADIRYDYLNQNQLRSGTKKISPAVAATTTNSQTGDYAEIEKFTKSQTITTTLDYNNGEAWGVSLVAPAISRTHSTLGVGGDGYSVGNGAYDSKSSGIGDIKLIGRYYGLSEQKNVGIQLGLKLPTGQKNQTGSTGTAVDPGLQLGTGTIDLIIGAYYHDNWSDDLGYFGQVLYQRALNHSTMDAGSYRTGDSINLNVGVRYEAYEWIQPTLQVNSRFVKADSGVAADTYATGGTLVYLTPGAIIPVGKSASIYSSVQLPIYQRVNGIQLTPSYIFSVGAKFNF
jgi:hypothetical protein